MVDGLLAQGHCEAPDKTHTDFNSIISLGFQLGMLLEIFQTFINSKELEVKV